MNRPEICGGLDTSVLMRLLTGEPVPLADAARRFLAGIEEVGGILAVSSLAVAEAYFACQHHYGMPKKAVLAGLHHLLSQPTFVVQPGLVDILAQDDLASAKPGFIDRLMHAEYAALGHALITFEKSAERLDGTRVLVPATEGP